MTENANIMNKILSILLLFAIGLFFTSCASTSVGGSRSYGEGGILKNRLDQCNGSCLQFSSDGKCVVFSRGISEVCIDYFNNLEK